MHAHLTLKLDLRQSGLITYKTAGSLHIAERGHVLVTELQQFTVVLQRAVDQIPARAPMETRASAVNGVIGTVLDPHILSRAREERATFALQRCTRHGRAVARRRCLV